MLWGDFSFDLLEESLERKNTLLQTDASNLHNDARDILAEPVLFLKNTIQRAESWQFMFTFFSKNLIC